MPGYISHSNVGLCAKPRRFLSYRALVALPAAMLVALVYVSCVFSDDSQIFEVAVGPELRNCAGAGSMMCMVVNGELFDGVIEGFDFVEGYYYLIKVERVNAWLGREEPPQDAMRHSYRLIEVISKTRYM